MRFIKLNRGGCVHRCCVQYCRITAIAGLPVDLLEEAVALTDAANAGKPSPVDYDTMIHTKLALLRRIFAAVG